MRLPKLNFPKYTFRFKKSKNDQVLIFDKVRKKWLVLTPEEWVRQNIIVHLIHSCGYPESVFKIETGLSINQNKTDNFFNRWKSPSERSMFELRNPNPDSLDDKYNLQAFKAEITSRYAIPINVIAFSILVVSFLLSFKFDRVDNISKILKVFGLIIFLQVISIPK